MGPARPVVPPAAGQPLARILARRLATVAICVLALQTVYVIWDYSRQEDYLATTVVSDELRILIDAVKDGGLDRAASGVLELPAELEARYRDFPDHYGFELLQASGGAIAAINRQVLRAIPVETGELTEAISREDTIGGQNRHYGSQTFLVDGKAYRWRVAIIADPAKVSRDVLLHEIADHVSMPAVPLILVMLATIWLVLRKTLRPLETAAAAVQRMAPEIDGFRLDLSGAPAEVVALGAAVNRLLERLHQALTAQRDFAANVAHELRTPLSLLTLELASIEGAAAQRAKADTLAMTNLIHQLLAMAQLEALDVGKLVGIDLCDLGRDVVAKFAPLALAAGKEIEFAGGAAVNARGQRETLEGALRNLLDNALRVTPVGGTIRVEVGDGPIVRVVDQGPGIVAGEEAAIFHRFHQGDRKSRGTAGLGLAIVKRTMELHGGIARAVNMPAGGACFSLEFSVSRPVGR